MIRNSRVFGGTLAALLMFFAPSARAETTQLHTSFYGMSMSGHEFYRTCRTLRADRARCLGYIQGLTDGIAIMQNALARDRARYPSWTPVCTPRGVTGDELVAVLVKFLKENPERRDAPVLPVFLRAVRQAWPCKAS